MVEAVGCAIVAFLYAVLICFSSMGVSILFGRTLDLIVLGHVIVLITFCGGGLGLVGWIKQRLGHPLINISCSLTSLAIITVLTKEGAVQAAEFSDDKIVQVMKMITMGVIATTAVSFLVYPVSAIKDLKKDLATATDSIGSMLALITRAFLTGSEEELKQECFLETSERYKMASVSMINNLNESRYEYYLVGKEHEYCLEVKLVQCMQRLAHSIGGLRSAARTQFLLLNQSGVSIPATPLSSSNAPTPHQPSSPFPHTGLSPLEHSALNAINEMPEEDTNPTIDSAALSPTLRSSPDVFARFIARLGPSMVSLCQAVEVMT